MQLKFKYTHTHHKSVINILTERNNIHHKQNKGHSGV